MVRRTLFFDFHRNRFDFGVELKGILAQLAADAGLFESAKWHGRLEDIVAVDPNGTSAQILAQVHGVCNVVGVNGSGQPIVCIITTFNDLQE